MCDVHLIELSRFEFPMANSDGICSHCDKPLAGKCIAISGYLDNGDSKILKFRYHEECEEEMRDILGDEGCFSFGTPISGITAS